VLEAAEYPYCRFAPNAQAPFPPHLARCKNGKASEHTAACPFYNRIAISRSPASGIDT
jgi:hypothetical protein